MLPSPSLTEKRLSETPISRFLREYFGNSAWFPLANLLLEILLEGAVYFQRPDVYAILVASLIQAFFLSRWKTTPRPRRLIGNLIGPTLYTLIEVSLEGPEFFQSPHHLAYWVFAFSIGVLQDIGLRLKSTQRGITILLENFLRANILLAMYAIFEYLTYPNANYTLALFLGDSSHQFISLAIPLLGISMGVAELTAQGYLEQLRTTSARLKTYAEWLLGKDFLDRLIANPEALSLTRNERSVLFMDIRGFTRWSEENTPEAVVNLLNRFYALVEEVLAQHQAIKFKFIADGVMAVFATPRQAVEAAQALQKALRSTLKEHGLGAGIGIHHGPLVEGLLGSSGVRFYDVIGDTVNVTQRLESAAAAGEILCSLTVHQALPDLPFGAARNIVVKGKHTPLTVYLLKPSD